MSEITLSFSSLTDMISEYRDEAKKDAKRSYPVVMSRGVEVAGSIKGEKISDGSPLNKLTKKELFNEIDQLIEKGCDNVTLQGGFDGAESVQAYSDSAYESLVSEWSFVIYKDGDFIA